MDAEANLSQLLREQAALESRDTPSSSANQTLGRAWEKSHLYDIGREAALSLNFPIRRWE